MTSGILIKKKEKKSEAVVRNFITCAEIKIPSPWVRNVAFERNVKLADLSTTKVIHILIGSNFI